MREALGVEVREGKGEEEVDGEAVGGRGVGVGVRVS